MNSLAKETVIIVHGTWAAPKPDQPNWYQNPRDGQHESTFVSKLNRALEERGSPARCWAHCKDNGEIFSWSGNNAWVDRTLAASSLATKINELQANGWRCHVVAHSHGGNVVAEALPAIIQTTDQRATVTTLGTPFIDAMTPIAKRIARRRKVLNVLAWSIYFYFGCLWPGC
jgi:hypothetical protein